MSMGDHTCSVDACHEKVRLGNPLLHNTTSVHGRLELEGQRAMQAPHSLDSYLLLQTQPVMPLRDPTSDMAVIARNGSALVKEVRITKEKNKHRARFWEVAGSKMAKITGTTEDEIHFWILSDHRPAHMLTGQAKPFMAFYPCPDVCLVPHVRTE